MDYYVVLRVSPNATLIEIRKSYRHLAILNHPDITQDPTSVQFMQSLNEAYSILSNPVKRAQYDFWRKYNAQVVTNPKNVRTRTSPLTYTQIGSYQTVPTTNSIRDNLEKITLFIGQIFYKLFYVFLFMLLVAVLFIIPLSFFIIIGTLSYWIAPYILWSSEDALGFTNLSTAALTLITIRVLRKQVVLSKFFRMLGL